jgi:hypothetical protein
MPRMSKSPRPGAWLPIVAAVLATGCTSTIRVTDTARTGTQQLLLNSAFDGAIEAVDFTPLGGATVFVDATNLEADGKGYLIYRIREALTDHGAILATARDQADVILEAGMAAYGTDSEKYTLGLTGNLQLPNATLRQRDDQYGVAQLSMFAYDRASGLPIWKSGPIRCDSWHRQQYLLGTGPYRAGSIDHPATSASKGPGRRFKRKLGEL